MNVKELIDRLSLFDPTLEVSLYEEYEGFQNATDIKTITVVSPESFNKQYNSRVTENQLVING